MANRTDRVILEEGWRNVNVRWAGVLDTSDVTLTPALSLSDLTNNDPRTRLVGLRVDEIYFSIGPGLEVILEWNAASPQLLAALTAAGKQCYDPGLRPDRLNPGYDGAINLRTQGFTLAAPAVYNLMVSFVKLTLG